MSPSHPPRPGAPSSATPLPTPRTERTRARILEATLELLAAKGHKGVSLAEVAELAGLSRAGVQHHFADVDGLVLAALDHRNLNNVRALHVLEARTVDELFAAMVRMMEFNSWTPELVRAYTLLSGGSVATGHPAHTWFGQHYAWARGSIAALLTRARDEGTIRADCDPATVAVQLVSLLEGVQILWLHDPDGIDLPAVVADAVDRVRRDLAPRS